MTGGLGRRFAALGLLFAAWLSAFAQPLAADPVALGRALFTGRIDGQNAGRGARQLARFACHSCHGRDALGGVEGDVPPIDARFLMRPTQTRPAYGEAAFIRAITQGVDAGDRALSRLMPRYDLTDDQARALFAYLQQVGTEQRRGVAPRAVQIGLPAVPGQPDLHGDLLAAIETGLSQALGGPAAYGRKVRIVPIARGDAAAAAGMLAVISPLAADVAAYTGRGIPVLFPLGALAGDEDPSIVRAATPDRQSQRRALARHLVETGAAQVTIEPGQGDGARALARDLRMERPDAPPDVILGAAGAAARDGDLVLLPGGALPEEGWRGRVILPFSLLRDGGLPPGARGEVIAMIETPWIVTRAIETRTHPVLVHGRRAGVALGEALKVAGRDVTRAGLLAALDDSVLQELGLDYEAHRLSGTARVDFVPLSGGGQ